MHFCLCSQKVFIVPSKRLKLFFFKYGEWGIKNLSFHTDFKNVSLILVRSAPKKSFSQKTVFAN